LTSVIPEITGTLEGAIVFLKTDIVPENKFRKTISGLPSPSISPAWEPLGPDPAG
jgi:hypothetical protein